MMPRWAHYHGSMETAMLRAALLVVALTLAISPAAADPNGGADEGEEQVQPDFGGQAAEEGHFDVLAYVRRLQKQIEGHAVPPPRSATDRALYDAWTAILKPRAARMAGRLKRLAAPKRWTYADGGNWIEHLDPGEWSRAVREMASLYTELGGALKQYDSFTVRYKPLPGAPAGPPDAFVLDRAIAFLERMEATFAKRRALGGVIWQDELRHYWTLVRHVDAELALYHQRLRKWEEAIADLEELQEKIFAGLEMKRRSLDLQMLSVRTLMSALQAAEEARLQRAVDDLPEEMRTEPAARLAALRGARRQAEGHRKEPSRYGATLRQKWLIARRAVLSELKKAAQTADASENDEAD